MKQINNMWIKLERIQVIESYVKKNMKIAEFTNIT